MHNALPADAYAEVVKRLAPEGALRDLLVLETTIDDWQRFIDFIRLREPRVFYREGDLELPLPMSVKNCFVFDPGQPTRLMSFNRSGIDFNCHFFAVDQLEIDIDPRQIAGRAALDSLLDFMFSLGRHLRKDVFLADEYFLVSAASPRWEAVICSYESASGKLRSGCEPRPLLVAPGEIAALERQRSWAQLFWSHLRLTVRGWGDGLDIAGTGNSRKVGSVQLMLLTSDEDVFIVAEMPQIGSSEKVAPIGTVSIDMRTTAPAQAADQAALELKEKILAALRR